VSRRDAVSCKPHPKIQPEKLHPQIGYRRFTPARGGQVCRISISPVRVLMSPEEEDGSKTKPSVACAGSRSCVPRGRGWPRSGRGWTGLGRKRLPTATEDENVDHRTGVDHVGCVAALLKSVPRGCLPDYTGATPMRCRNLDVLGQPRPGSVPECRGRPLCLPIRIAPVVAFKKGRHWGLPLRAAKHR
jgi:hypothetical protein